MSGHVEPDTRVPNVETQPDVSVAGSERWGNTAVPAQQSLDLRAGEAGQRRRAFGTPAPAAKASASQPTGALTGIAPVRSTFVSPEVSGDQASAVPLDQRMSLSVEEAGALLGISRDLAYDLVARRELPAVRLGRRLVVPRRALEEPLERLLGAG